MVLLRVDPGLVIWLWITFGLVVLILRFTAWDRIIGALDKRSARVVADLESAKQAAAKGASMVHEYDEKIRQGKEEAALIIEAARADASRLKEEAVRGAQEEIRQQRARGLLEIERAREEAEHSLKDEIVSISFTIANAILKKEISVSDNRRFVEEFAEKLVSRGQEGGTSAAGGARGGGTGS